MEVCGLKIDKRAGKWNLHNASDLDNLAYFFFLIMTRKIRKFHRYSCWSQIEHYRQCKGGGNSYKAAVFYLRKYKIKKIKEIINDRCIK